MDEINALTAMMRHAFWLRIRTNVDSHLALPARAFPIPELRSSRKGEERYVRNIPVSCALDVQQIAVRTPSHSHTFCRLSKIDVALASLKMDAARTREGALEAAGFSRVPDMPGPDHRHNERSSCRPQHQRTGPEIRCVQSQLDGNFGDALLWRTRGQACFVTDRSR